MHDRHDDADASSRDHRRSCIHSDPREHHPATKAVILAAGLGTRMRKADASVSLTAEQSAAADSGIKALIPVPQPMLDYALSALADAGITDVCIVVSPRSDAIRARYGRAGATARVRVHFAVQDKPLGSADALLAAEEFTHGEPFLVVNSDNYYPSTVLARLRAEPGPAVVAYSRAGLVRGGIPPERIRAYAVLEVQGGELRRIIEKPDPATFAAFAPESRVSMNSWRFTSGIFRACRDVPPSARGELELPLAVQYAIDVLGMCFSVVESDAEVLDLSSRADIPGVTQRLAAVVPRP